MAMGLLALPRRTLPSVIWWSSVGGLFLMSEVPLYVPASLDCSARPASTWPPMCKRLLAQPSRRVKLAHMRQSCPNVGLGFRKRWQAVQGYLAHEKCTPLGPHGRTMPRGLQWS